MLLISSILSIAQNVKFDGVIVSNLAATDIGSVVVDDLYVQCQAFTTDGTKYDLLSASLSVEDGGENIHLWLYAALSDGKIDVAGGALVTFGAPSLVSGSVYQFTPSIPSSFTLQANTTYWLVFNAAASPNDASINFTTDMSSLGPGTIPSSNTYAESADGGSSYTYGDGLPSMFSVNGNIIPPTITWDGSAGTDWATEANWSSNTVPTESDYVTIPGTGSGVTNWPVANEAPATPAVCTNLTVESGGILAIAASKALTVSGTLLNNAGNSGLVIESGGSLIHNSNSVAATVKREITGSSSLTANKYHFVSIPTQYATPTSNLFLGSYLYKLDPAQQIDPPTNPAYGKWVSLGNSTTTELNTNKGYMIYYPGDSKEYTFTGNLNNGTYAYSLTGHSGSGVYTFNLVPNPYPSSLIWNTGDAAKWTKSAGIGGSCYIWNAGSGNYSTIASGATNYIPVGQAFMVLVTDDDAPALSVLNAARTHSSQAFYKSASEIENQLVIKALSNNYADETVVKFTTEAFEGFDLQTDGLKLFGLEDAPQLYTLTADQKFSINNLPTFEDQIIVPLNFESQFTGQVTLNFEGMENFDPSVSIYLKDELTNQSINLRNQPVYTFIHNPENAANRFKLVFGGTIGIEESPTIPGNLWISGNTLYIAAPKLAGQSGLIEVYNASGQKLMSKTIVLSELSTVELNFKGFVVARLTTGNEGMTVKGILMK